MTSASPTQAPGLLERELRARPTPLLRLALRGAGSALVKLESLRASGGVYERALAAWDAHWPPGAPPPGDARPGSEPRQIFAELSSAELLAAAAWARARGLSLQARVHGRVTHEVDETRKLWGARLLGEGEKSSGVAMPSLSEQEAIEACRRSLGAELREQLAGQTISALMAPAGALAALLGAGLELRASHPRLALLAIAARESGESGAEPREEPHRDRPARPPAPGALPELPSFAEARGALARLLTQAPPELRELLARVELIDVSCDEAVLSRARLAREHGLSASHAAAAAIFHAAVGEASRAAAQGEPASIALALLTTTGERELSLDARA